MSNQTWTYIAIGSAAGVSLIAWVALVLVRGGSNFFAGFAAVTAAVVVAAVLGLTRVYLRAHYISDVFGGWGLAVAIFGLLGVLAVVVGRLRHNDPPES